MDEEWARAYYARQEAKVRKDLEGRLRRALEGIEQDKNLLISWIRGEEA